ncbi:alpha/beta hydrolase [Qipengyuania sp. YIM B01966]|uniref:alpha/beta hydrolase n=1 Tax=Qipengyuania sp. YIM B01966 TaxID=2778646 RepID=UPI0018F3CAD7|nr:alpha/beta hydrolase [Qipengyuania sp. YIM B01966]
MKKRPLYYLASAILIPSMALFACTEPGRTQSTDSWGAAVDPDRCRQALQRLPAALRSLRGQDCVAVRASDLVVATIELEVAGEVLPVRVVVGEGNNSVRKIVVEIVGGPGETVLLRPGIESWAREGKQTIADCDVAILSPAYSGTWHRSSYPAASERRAATEVDGLLSVISSSTDVSIVAQSLGGRIVSRPEVRIPDGRHLLFVPLLQAPQGYLRWLDEGSTRNRIMRRSSVSNYVIGTEGNRASQAVRTFDFLRAFFETSKSDLAATLPELWAQKSRVGASADVEVVIADKEDKAGGPEFSEALSKLGFTVRTVAGEHLPNGQAETAERAEIVGRFLQAACASGKS